MGVAFDQEVLMQKRKYIRGLFPVRTELPPGIEELSGGLILDLPDSNIKEYLQKKLDLRWMPTDEDLINNLESMIEESSKKRKNQSALPNAYVDSSEMNAGNLLELPGLSRLDQTKREQLRKKFQ